MYLQLSSNCVWVRASWKGRLNGAQNLLFAFFSTSCDIRIILKYKVINKNPRVPWKSSSSDSKLPLLGPRVQSPVGELRSGMLCGVAKKKKMLETKVNRREVHCGGLLPSVSLVDGGSSQVPRAEAGARWVQSGSRPGQ